MVYGANAIACERGFAGRTPLDQPLVPTLVLGATALALMAVVVVATRVPNGWSTASRAKRARTIRASCSD